MSLRVLIFGTFDRLHPGHHFVINEALKRGDTWVVVARDRNVSHIKGRAASETEQHRLQMVQEAFPKVHAVLGDEKDFLIPVRTLKPTLILLGYDQRLPPGVQESDFPCPIERLPSFQPEKYKSSLMPER